MFPGVSKVCQEPVLHKATIFYFGLLEIRFYFYGFFEGFEMKGSL